MNPILTYCNHLQADLLSTREALFSELKDVNQETERFARSILEQKEKRDKLPSLGEIFPWLLCDLLHLEKNIIGKSNIGWLGLYIYTIYVDNLLDEKQLPQPHEILSSSVIQGLALRNLSSLVINTTYEKEFYNNLYGAVQSEFMEVELKSNIMDLTAKEEIARGKNRILLAYACCLAATSSSRSKEIFEISNSLLLALQFLDDISDFENDYESINYSFLLSFMLQNKESSLLLNTNNSNPSRSQILKALVISNALPFVLDKIIESLNLTIEINSIETNWNYDSKAIKFIEQLLNNVKAFRQYLTQINNKYIDEQILDKVEQHIKLIAQSS